MARRAVPSTVMSALLLCATFLALGPPDFALAKQMLVDGDATTNAALAIVGIICWGVIIVVAIAAVVMTAKTASDSQIFYRRWTRAIMFVAAGVIVFGMGAFHHLNSGLAMSPGNPTAHLAEAEQLVSSH